MPTDPNAIDEYLRNVVDPAQRAALERIRALVHRLVPEVEESVSYRMPTLSYRGRALVYFTASNKHMSFYPSSWALDELRDRLSGYRTTQHSVQFTIQNPLPDELLEDLVLVHKRVIDAGQE